MINIKIFEAFWKKGRIHSSKIPAAKQQKKKPIKFYLVFAKLKVSAKEESKKKKAFIPGAGDSVELDRNVGPKWKSIFKSKVEREGR